MQLLNGQLYVTFALQDPAKHDDVAGAWQRFCRRVRFERELLTRLIIWPCRPLDSPWGLAIAPAEFSGFAGDLLVGNFGNGEIDAFNPTTGAFVGTLDASSGSPIEIPGLWDLSVGNGGPGVNPNAIYFTAGLPNAGMPGLLEQAGLFGNVSSVVPEPASIALLATGLAALRCGSGDAEADHLGDPAHA